MTSRQDLLEALGVELAEELLSLALTHRSYAYEHGGLPTNERLEFLGDAVLGFVVGEMIYRSFPSLQEGALSKIKAHLVSANMLSAKARALGVGRFLRMGAGEARSGGAEKPSLLADAFEAVVAAVYLESGYDAARDVVVQHLEPAIVAASNDDTLDPKTRLRRWAENQGLGVPHYEVVASGPSHDTTFEATVSVGALVARASGPSKKRAEVNAAAIAWEEMIDA